MPSRHRRHPLRSLRVSEPFKAFVLDQLAELGVRPRPMFGGVGLYHEDLFFGILAADTLYLKVDQQTKADYEAAGARPFQPYADRTGTMHYYEVPLSVLECAPDLARWARKAIGVAERMRRDG